MRKGTPWARYDKGEKWWLEDAKLQRVQRDLTEERAVDDAREVEVRSFLEGKKYVQMHEILIHLGYEIVLTAKLDPKMAKSATTAVGILLRRLRWKRWRNQNFGPAGAGTYYFPPEVHDTYRYACGLVNEMKKIEKEFTQAFGDDPPF